MNAKTQHIRIKRSNNLVVTCLRKLEHGKKELNDNENIKILNETKS